eukprot:GHVH01000112.1.p1 GENE.GHVH01000112.1~~GHVH01000112.1.p1  ORF type:complete len:180 (-),score=25.83 GHVH01000112.1:40-579(-)
MHTHLHTSWDIRKLILRMNSQLPEYFEIKPFTPVVHGTKDERDTAMILENIPKVTVSSVLIDSANMTRKQEQREKKREADPMWAGEGIKLRNRKALQTMFSESAEIQAMIPELAGNKSLKVAQKTSEANRKLLENRKEFKAQKKEKRRFKNSEKTKQAPVKKCSIKPDSVLISKVIGRL